MNNEPQACANSDVELWRKVEGDYYAPSLFVTADGRIGINVAGTVYVKPIEAWHELAGGKIKGVMVPQPPSPAQECVCGETSFRNCPVHGNAPEPKMKPCPFCEGSKWMWLYLAGICIGKRDCLTCEGRGEVEEKL